MNEVREIDTKERGFGERESERERFWEKERTCILYIIAFSICKEFVVICEKGRDLSDCLKTCISRHDILYSPDTGENTILNQYFYMNEIEGCVIVNFVLFFILPNSFTLYYTL